MKRHRYKNNKDLDNDSSLKKKNLSPILFLVFLVLFVYFNSLGNDFVSDDISGIVQNHNLSFFNKIFSQPLSLVRNFLYFLAFQFFSLKPFAYHIINLIFHSGSTVLVYLILNAIATSPVALFSAAIFAVHPLLSEGVTWISGGPYPQYSFFFLLSFLLYIKHQETKKTKFYFLSLFSFILSLLSTEKGAILPLILVVYDFFQRTIKTSWRKIIPYFLLSILCFLAYLSSGSITQRVETLQTNYYQNTGYYNPLIQMPTAISSYLYLFFVPMNLTLYHTETVFTPFEYSLRLIITLLYFCVTLFFLLKDRRVFFWLAFFLISLLPMLTPLKISWVVAERYAYLGSIGLIVSVAFLTEFISKKISEPKMFWVILTLLVSLLGTRTMFRNQDWKNQDVLWLATAKNSPLSPQNHNNLGDYYGRHGNFEKAIEEFQTAIKLQPNYGDAYHNLGNIYLQTHHYDQALASYQKALEFNPNLWQSYVNIGMIYYNYGDKKRAQEEFQKALIIDPQNTEIKRILLQTNP